MFFRRFRPAQSGSPRELEELGAALDAAFDEFGRELGRHCSRRRAGQSRSIMSARLSSLPGYRPRFDHPHRLPPPYRRGEPRTALSLERDQYGRPLYAHEVKARTQGIVARLRQQLLRLRGALGRLYDRFRGRRTPPVRSRRMLGARTGIGAGASRG